MQTIQLHLTLDEVNLILEGLGDLPFSRVHALIGKIQQQAQEQLEDQTPPSVDPPDDGSTP